MLPTEASWRLLAFETHRAARNMAIDEAILEGVVSGQSPPTIRFYGWSPGAVSIGHFQRIADEVDLEVCKSRGFDVVRRQTGGGAVYHDPEGEITYSIVAPQSFFDDGITASYNAICGRVIQALERAGISADFRPINDIVVGNEKISGNAQTRRNGVLLQHGTVLFDVNADTMFSVLKVSNQKISDKQILDLKRIVTSVREHSTLTRAQWFSCMKTGFCDGWQVEDGLLLSHEQKRADELMASKYTSDEWTHWR